VTPGSALPDPRIIIIFQITVLTPGSVLPGSARHHKEFLITVLMPGSALPDPRIIIIFQITVLTPGSVLPGSARHHKEFLITVLMPGSILSGSARHHKIFDNGSDTRIRTPGSVHHHKKFYGSSARPDPHARIREAS
jgi:hypothetical protein